MTTRILVVDDSPTIRKVVAGLLERHGYEAVAAADGQQALDLLVESAKPLDRSGSHAVQSRPFDLVLLDFVMPRMNGFQFCRLLRAHEDLRATPVILMSAKSDKIREQFVLQTGAIDAITKPFDATALVAVIENAVNRSSSWRLRAEALAAGIPEDFDGDSTRPPPPVDSDSRKVRVANELVARIAAVVAPIVAKLAKQAASDEEQLAGALLANLSPDALHDVAETLRTSGDLGTIGQVSLSGELAFVPIGAILQLLQIENLTGVLSVSNGKSEVSIAIRKGLIDLVQARGAGQEFRLGRYFIEHGLVTPEQIEALLRARDSQPPPAPPKSSRRSSGFAREETTQTRNVRLLGEMLIDTGRVTREQLKEALARQSSELTYEVLRWQKGRFEFRREPASALASSAELGLPVASVVMEGFRRVDEWRLVESGLGSFDSVLQKDAVALDALGDGRLSKPEKVVLDAIDGERTVREIVSASHMSSFDACKILYQLLEARLVRRRGRTSHHGEDTIAPPPPESGGL